MSMLAFSLFITIVSAFLETYFVYKQDIGTLNKQFDQIEVSFVQGLSNTLWIIDTKLAQIQIEGILALPNIQYVEIISSEIPFTSSGIKPNKKNSLSREYKLNYETLDIGKLIVVADLSVIYSNAISNFKKVFIYEGISIFIVVLFMTMLVNKMILRHFEKLSRFMRTRTGKNINQAFKLERKLSRTYEDELDILVKSFNDLNKQRLELKQTHKDLALSESRYIELAESSIQSIWIHVNFKPVFINKACIKIFGYESEKEFLAQDSILNCVAPYERERITAYKDLRLAGGNAPTLYEFDGLRKDGSIINFIHSARLIDWDDGKAILCTFIDITERKSAETKLRESEDRLHKIFECSPDVIMVSQQKDGIIIDVNKNFESVFKYKNCDVIGKSVMELNMWFNTKEWPEILQQLSERGSIKDRETQYRKSDNQLAYCYLSSETVEINSEICIVTTIRDITEQRAMQNALRQSEEKFSKAFLSSPHPIGISTLDNAIILEVNDAFEEVFGYSRDEIIGISSFELGLWVNPEMRATFIDKVRSERGVREFEAVAKIKSGQLIHCYLSAELINIENENCIVIMIQDITEHKRAEEEILISRERLRNLATRLEEIREEERIGIAREVHDELGQALTGLKIDLSWLSEKIPKSITTTERIKSMIHNIDTTVDVVRKISSQLRPPVLDDLGLEAAIEWVTEGFSKRTKIAYELHLQCDDMEINNIRDTTVFRIYQEALTNIARHSAAKNFEADIRIDNNELKLWIKDDGIGITAEQMQDNKSIGLIGMQERAKHIGATFSISNLGSGGTLVTLCVPLTPETNH